MGVCVAAIAVGLYSIGCLSLGMIVLHVFRVNRAGGTSVSVSGYLGSAFAVGQGILGVTWQSIAVIGYFSPEVVAGLLSALLLVVFAGAGQLQTIARSIWGAVRDLWKEGVGWCTIAVFLMALMVAITSLTSYPPIGGRTGILPFHAEAHCEHSQILTAT